MQNCRVAVERLECINTVAERNVHVLTRQLADCPGTLQLSVRVGRAGGGKIAGKGSFGIRIGILGTLKDYPEQHNYRNNLWPALGVGLVTKLTDDFIDHFGNPFTLSRSPIAPRSCAPPCR